MTARSDAGGVWTVLPALSERASRRRSLDERLRVRFPSVFRVLSEAGLRVSPHTRLRRLVLRRALVRVYAAANRRDFDLIRTTQDPERYEYRPSDDLRPLDLDPVFHGHEGYLRLWGYWLDAFADIRWEPQEMLDLGDRILVTARQQGHGSGSGVAVGEHVFQLFTFRRGLVIRQQDFSDRAKALEAAGVPGRDAGQVLHE